MEEVIKGGKSSISVKKGGRRRKGWVACRDRNRVASCEREEKAWGKGTFEVHMMLRLRKGGEQRVKVRPAHDGRGTRDERVRVDRTSDMNVGRAVG